MFASLLLVDVRHAVAHLHHTHLRGKLRVTYAIAIFAVECNGSLVELGIEEVFCAVLYIVTPHLVALGIDFTVAIHISELQEAVTLLLICAAEDSRMLGGSEIHHYAKVVEIYRVAVGRGLLVVVAIWVIELHNRLITTEGHHKRHIALTVRRHIHRQAAHTVGGEFVVSGIHTQHSVGELCRWECRHQQMADVTNAVVHKVHRLFLA